MFSIRSEILGLLENTLIGNYEYSRSNRGDLLLPIQIKLSKKPETFCDLFLHLWYLYQISNVLKKKKKNDPRVYLKLLTAKDVLF